MRAAPACLFLVLLDGCAATHRADGEQGDVPLVSDGGLPPLHAPGDDGDGDGDQLSGDDGAGRLMTQAFVGVMRGPYMPCDHPAEEPIERVLLLLEFDGRGELVAASLTLGDGEPLAPPTDPNVYYPPDPTWSHAACPKSFGLRGFTYAASVAHRSAEGIRLEIELDQPFRAWCALQPTYPIDERFWDRFGSHACRPVETWRFVLDDTRSRDPNARCVLDCRCDAAGCTTFRPSEDDLYAREPYGQLELGLQEESTGVLSGWVRTTTRRNSETRSEVRLGRVR